MKRESRTATIRHLDSARQDKAMFADIPEWAWWHFRHIPYQRRGGLGQENIRRLQEVRSGHKSPGESDPQPAEHDSKL